MEFSFLYLVPDYLDILYIVDHTTSFPFKIGGTFPLYWPECVGVLFEELRPLASVDKKK
jgi:hypothetical protein